jgi:hypothetical protein
MRFLPEMLFLWFEQGLKDTALSEQAAAGA